MLRPHSIAPAVTGVAATILVACSGTVGPSNTVGELPGNGTQASATAGPTITPQESGTTEGLIGISSVNSRVVWASGRNGTFVRTTDGGRTWRARQVPGAETLQFRDVEGVSAKEAYLLSIGPGTDSRIYKTVDGGDSWTVQFQNENPNAFYDCFAFWNPNRGLTFSDPVGGIFPVIRTTNGRTWQNIGGLLPAAEPGEFAFAASGTCVATQGGKRAWIVTGGVHPARVLATVNGGDSWAAYETPLVPGSSGDPSAAGGFSVAFRDPFNGIIAGGDLAATGVVDDNVVRSRDGGRTWVATSNPAPIPGAVFGASYVPGQHKVRVVATGPTGTAWSADEGDTWSLIPGLNGFWSVAFATHKAGWLVGTGGRIVKVSF